MYGLVGCGSDREYVFCCVLFFLGLCVLRNGGAGLSGDSALCKGILETLSPREGTLRVSQDTSA